MTRPRCADLLPVPSPLSAFCYRVHRHSTTTAAPAPRGRCSPRIAKETTAENVERASRRREEAPPDNPGVTQLKLVTKRVSLEVRGTVGRNG